MKFSVKTLLVSSAAIIALFAAATPSVEAMQNPTKPAASSPPFNTPKEAAKTPSAPSYKLTAVSANLIKDPEVRETVERFYTQYCKTYEQYKELEAKAKKEAKPDEEIESPFIFFKEMHSSVEPAKDGGSHENIITIWDYCSKTHEGHLQMTKGDVSYEFTAKPGGEVVLSEHKTNPSVNTINVSFEKAAPIPPQTEKTQPMKAK